MTRPTLRRTPMLERLETRQVLSGVALSADKQYALELINLVRTNPVAAGERLTANLGADVQATLGHFGLTANGLKAKLATATPLPPLAYDSTLDNVAQNQSQYEADHALQTHQGPGEGGLADRFAASGFSNPISEGENTYAYADSVDQAMQSFLFDWGVSDNGHYNNLLQPGVSASDAYQSVGIGMVRSNNKGVGPLVFTQDFGSQQGQGPQLLGVSFIDNNHDHFYAPGEGKGGLTIDAVNLSTRAQYETQTGEAGGYQMPVAPNADYQVNAVLNGQVVQSQRVHVGNANEKVDFILGDVVPVTPPPAPPAPVPPTFATQVITPVAAPQVALVAAPEVTPVAAPQVAPIITNVEPVQATQAETPDTTPAPTPAQPATPPSWLSKWSRWKAINNASGM